MMLARLGYCFLCCKAVKERKVDLMSYTNWKDVTRIFAWHEKCEFHRLSCAALANKVNVGDLLSKQAATQQRNRQYLLKVLSSIRYLAHQGLSFRGDGDETDSNFHQLLLLWSEDYTPMNEYLQRKQLKYTVHDVQNEVLSIMSQQIFRAIALQIQNAVYFSVMIDETSDCSNKEEVVLVFRRVGEDLVVPEEFLRLHLTESITSAALVSIIEDTILRINIKIENCRGQCYDGASALTGAKNCVALVIVSKESRAIFSHCYGHALNLGVGDTNCQLMKFSLAVVAEISKLIKKSPKRDAISKNLKQILLLTLLGFGFFVVQHGELCVQHLSRVYWTIIKYCSKCGMIL